MASAVEAHWDPSREGFLPASANASFFCEALRPHHDAYEELPMLAREGAIGSRLENLPVVDIVFAYESYYDPLSCVLLTQVSECESVFTLFGILAGAFVHKNTVEFAQEGAQERPPQACGPIILPACISVPLKQLADHLGRKPILDYAGCVLANWALIDEYKPMSPSNIRILRTFTRTAAEEWFYKIHAVIEYHGGLAIRSAIAIVEVIDAPARTEEDNADSKVGARLVMHLRYIAEALAKMNAALGRMREHCREADFFNIVRPWLSGWPAPGVVYSTKDSHDFAPELYTGGSGAQSSIMPCLDALFGVGHGAQQVAPQQEGQSGASRSQIKQTETVSSHLADREKFIQALKRYREYMPPPHRDLIARLETSKSLRDHIATMETQQKDLAEQSRTANLPLAVSENFLRESINLNQNVVLLKQAYNRAMEQIVSFRLKHVGITISYITSQAKRRAESFKASGSASTGEALLKKSTKGTGGSNFKFHLTQHIRDSRSCLYELPKNIEPPPRPPAAHVMPGLGSRLPSTSPFGRPPVATMLSPLPSPVTGGSVSVGPRVSAVSPTLRVPAVRGSRTTVPAAVSTTAVRTSIFTTKAAPNATPPAPPPVAPTPSHGPRDPRSPRKDPS